jgi:flagellar hook-length control protein FliK
MQSLNVITNILSQDTDLNIKDNLEQSYNHDEKANFSHLVNQHIAEEKRTSANKEQSKREHTHPEVSRKTFAASEREEPNDITQQATDQIKSESEISEQVSFITVENTSENPTSSVLALSIEYDIDDSNESYQDVDGTEEKVTVKQHSPEQFMSLLYNSDKTLTSSTADSNLSIAQEDTDKQLSDFDVARVNPLKMKSLETESAKSELTDYVSRTLTKQGEASIHNLVEEKNSLSSLDTAVKKIPENSADKKLNQPAPQASLVVASQLKSKAIPKHDEVKQQPTSKVNSELSSQTGETSADQQFNKNNEIIRGVLGDITLPEKSSKNQSSQGFSTSNNQPEVYQGDKQTSHQIEPDIIDDAIGLQSDNMVESHKNQAVNVYQKNTTSTNPEAKTTQPENLIKGLTINNKIIPENNVDNVNALQANDKYIEKEFYVVNQTINRSENMSQRIIKNSAEQSQNSVTDDEYLKENPEESISSEIDDILLNVDKPKVAKSVNIFSDNTTSRLSQEVQFQTSQTLQNKHSNEAYLAHQVTEALHHNIASDIVHIQKNNIQLQQETIAIFRKDFADAVKDKVLVMINQKLQKFEITLDPPEFGNMQVRVNLQGEQASVNFVVQNQQAKEALEHNMQKLKDMLSEQGVDVGGANVEQQNQRDQNEQRNNFTGSELNNDTLLSEAETQQVFSANIHDISETAIDYYA